jgi:hypothetical protein
MPISIWVGRYSVANGRMIDRMPEVTGNPIATISRVMAGALPFFDLKQAEVTIAEPLAVTKKQAAASTPMTHVRVSLTMISQTFGCHRSSRPMGPKPMAAMTSSRIRIGRLLTPYWMDDAITRCTFREPSDMLSPPLAARFSLMIALVTAIRTMSAIGKMTEAGR